MLGSSVRNGMVSLRYAFEGDLEATRAAKTPSDSQLKIHS